MKKLYTAVGRMQFKGRNRDMRCPMVLLNNKEYILDIQEMMIWSILNWRILSDDEIKTLYENKAQETGYMTHRSAAECMQRPGTARPGCRGRRRARCGRTVQFAFRPVCCADFGKPDPAADLLYSTDGV